MSTLEITHIDKPDRHSSVEAIRSVAGPDWGPSTLAAAVEWAEKSGNHFIVRSYMATVEVKVMPPKSIYGSKYLQTVADKTETNNLLSLPQIPAEKYKSA